MVDYSASELRAKRELLERCVEKGIEDGEFAGASFLLAKDNEELVYFDRGWADIAQRKPIRRECIYRCYSMTKTVTSAAVFTLVEDGKLDLRDPVEKFLPSFANAMVETKDGPVHIQQPITIQNLLNMTSGLGYGDTDTISGRDIAMVMHAASERLGSDRPMTTQEFAESLGRCTLSFEPGTSWKYGVSADILGAIVELVSGKKYGTYLKEKIFDPLGMKDTGFFVPEEKRSRLVTAYETEADTHAASKPVKESAISAEAAAPDIAMTSGTIPAASSTAGLTSTSSAASLVPFTDNHLCIRNDGRPNPLESGGAGLFSTIDDFYQFTQMLLRGGRGLNGNRILRLGTVQFMTRHALSAPAQASFDKSMPGLEGFTYSNLFRIMQHPELASTISREGEYGWDGALGTYWCNSPTDGVTILFMMNQKGYETGHVTHLLRNIVFG